MKLSCPNCHTILEINENDYSTGEIVSRECPICGEIIEYEIPQKLNKEIVYSENSICRDKIEFEIPNRQDKDLDPKCVIEEQSKETNKTDNIVRVQATKLENQLANNKTQENAKQSSPSPTKRSYAWIYILLCAVLSSFVFLFFYLDESFFSTQLIPSDSRADAGREMIIDFYRNFVFSTEPEKTIDYYCMPSLIRQATIEIDDEEYINMSQFAGYRWDFVWDGQLIDVINEGDQWYSVVYTEEGKRLTTRVLVTQYNGRYMILKTIPFITNNLAERNLEENKSTPHQENLSDEDGSYGYSDSDNDNSSVPLRDNNGHSFVDLGLPSGVCWATCNLGAQSSSDKGDHFAWGETSKKYEYTQSTYQKDLGNNVLDLAFDAAASQWGGTWRIPTREEWQELVNCCSWSWNGEGYRVSGENGNSIFLPAAGYSKGSSRFKEGERGDYWTSTPLGSQKSYEFVIKSDAYGIESDNRFYGISIRPVTN